MHRVKPGLAPLLAVAAVCLLLATPFPVAASSDALRCDGRLVERGDFKVEVLQACGEPDFVDPLEPTTAAPYASVPNFEQWYYNFGPSQLLQVLRFQDGRLKRIDAAGYGFSAPDPGECNPNAIEVGDSKYRLLAFCGEPAQADSFYVFSNRHRPRRPGPYHPGHLGRPQSLIPVLRELWVYNFGPSHLLREIILENGRVVQIDTGDGRGF